jgi:hypothetical protein
MQLNTSYDMNTSTIFAKETLFVAGYQQPNSAGGGINFASTADTYDLNENGSYSDRIAGVSSSNNPSCQIVSQNAMLDVEDCITVTSNNVTTPSTTASESLSANKTYYFWFNRTKHDLTLTKNT